MLDPVYATPADPRALLSPRELEVLEMASLGLTNSEIGRRLHVSVHAVKFHLAAIYRKLGVANRTEASRWAQLNGLLTQQPPDASSVSA